MEAGHGGTELSRRGHPRHRAGNGARSGRGVPRRGRCQGRRRVQGDRWSLRAVRSPARARHAYLGTGDSRRRHGGGDDWLEADRRDNVLGLLRGVLRLHRQRIPQEPLHVERANEMPAGGAHRQRRRFPFRRPALPERRKLVHDDPGPQGRGTVDAARRHWSSCRRRARSRPGHLPRAQIALRDQGRSAGRRDRRYARHRQDRAPRQGRHDHRAGADGAARAGGGREAQGGTRHRRGSCRCALASAARHPDHSRFGRQDASAVHG